MSKKTTEAIFKLIELLAIEKEEDQRQYIEQFEKCSITERKKNGLTWYPVVVVSEELGPADNLIIEVERTTDHEQAHQFSSGKIVELFSNTAYGGSGGVQGTIRQVVKNRVRIALNADELPDWSGGGKLGLNLMFDENSYREMLIALQKVMQADGNRLAELRETLYGNRVCEFDKRDESIVVTSLNRKQNEALQLIDSAKDVAIVHGPPGTGKTTTLVQAIRHTLMKEKQVLVCSPSNTAVDLLTEKLAREGINVLRLGNPARVSDEVINNTLDVKVTSHESYQELKDYRKKAEEYFALAKKYKRNFGASEREQRNLLYTEARNILKEASMLEDYIFAEQFDHAQVIACTPVVSSSRQIRDKIFSTVFIDEAAQALEPMSWIPVTRAKRVIFAGDHQQLPPTVKSKKAGDGGLRFTLFERCIAAQKNASVMLNVQYRMHETIMGFSNGKFYEGKLTADDTVKDNLLSFDEEETLLHRPFDFIDTAGCGFTEEQNPESLSMSNPEEGQLLFKYLRMLLGQYDVRAGMHPALQVGIISPYKQQVELLAQILESDELLKQSPHKIAVKTIDGFQGQERDVICISLVRSNDTGEIGFLSDYRRLNVALTRAKRKLVVFGDSATLSRNSFYKDFLEYAENCGAYKSAWEFLYSE
ncbi:MAG: ATPase [Bacteroidetes bacterium]|nr:MAG: ATPase [Bacteroidota bacterium]